MILVDLSQTLHAAIAIEFTQDDNSYFSEDRVRFITLNIIRANKVKFEKEFGKVVICCDAPAIWRRKVFPYYKFKRVESKEESLIDWGLVYKSFNLIREEIKEHFVFPVIHVDGCEGDDVIAIMCQNFPDEKIKILSSDKDFVQLHTNPNVSQYSPTMKSDVTNIDPVRQLRKLVLKGDKSDGVPSVFSNDNYLAVREKGDRSKSISEKMITESFEDLEEFLTKYDVKRNYLRNEQLIDLSKIPQEFTEIVLNEYRNQLEKPKKTLLPYFVKNKQKMLLERVNDFA